MTRLKDILLSNEEKKVILLGNEAIARGALEAGVGVVTGYPGTPSTEVLDSLASVTRETGVYVEYSVNEKAAFESALAAAWARIRSMTIMKHVGLNVAADPLLSSVGTGVNAGFIIMVADDPSMWSSQNEQDTRYYALFSNVPVVEPVSPQEAKDMVMEVFNLSEKHGHPIILRTTTRVSHMLGDVMLGPLPEDIIKGNIRTGDFQKDIPRYTVIPAHARKMRPKILEKIERIREDLEDWPFNWIENPEEKTGILASGISYAYVKEALEKTGLHNIKILKLSTPFPIPQKTLKEFLEDTKKVLIVEELEPIVESQVKQFVYDHGYDVEVVGKKLVPRIYELSTTKVLRAVSLFMGKPMSSYVDKILERKKSLEKDLPPRPPTLCPACPHRNTFFAIRKAVSPRSIFPSDIGCYSLGLMPPLKTVDTIIDMGASISNAHGLDKAINRKEKKKMIVATIGDSTFFHTGIPALANAIYNNSNIVVVVLDNRVTAMTGHQPHPGTGITPSSNGKEIRIEDVAKALGANYVRVVDPYNIRETIQTIKEASESPGVSVVIARRACSLIEVSKKRRKGEKWPIYQVNPEKCTGCKICINAYGCPAIHWDDENKKAYVDTQLCWGCGGCAQICPYDAFYITNPEVIQE